MPLAASASYTVAPSCTVTVVAYETEVPLALESTVIDTVNVAGCCGAGAGALPSLDDAPPPDAEAPEPLASAFEFPCEPEESFPFEPSVDEPSSDAASEASSPEASLPSAPSSAASLPSVPLAVGLFGIHFLGDGAGRLGRCRLLGCGSEPAR